MKKFLTLVLSGIFFSLNTFANCDWATGITPGPNKTFIYSEVCHQQVGIMKQENLDLQKALFVEKDATNQADIRANLWRDNSVKMEDQFREMDQATKSNNELYFGLGVGMTVLAVITTAIVIHNAR